MSKPFNLEAAQRGEPICFRNGDKGKLRFIIYDEKTDNVICGLKREGKDEHVISFYHITRDSCNPAANKTSDLMMYEPIRKQFNYDEYIKKPSEWELQTKEGSPARFIAYADYIKIERQIIFARFDNEWVLTYCKKNGYFYEDESYSNNDLFMIEVTP